MDRRVLLASGLSLIASKALAQNTYGQAQPPSSNYPAEPPPGYYHNDAPPPPPPRGDYPAYREGPPPPSDGPLYPTARPAETYSQDEIVRSVSNFFGVTAEAAGAVIEKVFHENGRPTGYIAGTEGAAAFTVGLRYGKGLLYMKNRESQMVFWQGPSIGWDLGGNASRVFTLAYGIQAPDQVYQRFPGVEGSAYLVGGMGVNYQRADAITLAPIRAGVGLRLGANVGYLSYSRERHIFPF